VSSRDSSGLIIYSGPKRLYSDQLLWPITLMDNARKWESFLKWIGFPENLARHTLSKRPPPQLKTPEDGWEYLRGIALGQTKVRLCGPKCRDSVKAFLEEQGQLPPEEES
jgi:hypothetical protein